MERAERTVTTLHRVMTKRPCQSPAWPTTHARRRNNMVPQIFSRHLINTPSIQPNLMTWLQRSVPPSEVVIYKYFPSIKIGPKPPFPKQFPPPSYAISMPSYAIFVPFYAQHYTLKAYLLNICPLFLGSCFLLCEAREDTGNFFSWHIWVCLILCVSSARH